MEQVAQQLVQTLDKALPLLKSVQEEVAAIRPAAGKWSKKEILGHLIDSAGNNQQKFVRTMQAQTHAEFVGYAQDFWVEKQPYATAPWEELVQLWYHFNRHLARTIAHTPGAYLNHTLSIDGSGPFTLAFIMRDYVEHLKHHLNQMFPEAGFESAFENLY